MKKLNHIATLTFMVRNTIDEKGIKGIVNANKESMTSEVILWYDEDMPSVVIMGDSADVFENEPHWLEAIKHALNITD